MKPRRSALLRTFPRKPNLEIPEKSRIVPLTNVITVEISIRETFSLCSVIKLIINLLTY